MCNGAGGQNAGCFHRILRSTQAEPPNLEAKTMKPHPLTRIAIITALIFAGFSSPLLAEVQKNGNGTYTISGTWTFWEEKDLLAPTGKDNDFGEFKTILFKSPVNDFEGIRKYKKKQATFKVKARESQSGGGEKILVVEEILEVVKGADAQKPEPKKTPEAK